MYLAMDILVASRITSDNYDISSPFLLVGDIIVEMLSGRGRSLLLILKSFRLLFEDARNSFYFWR
jgi:hypothetical protein